MLNIEHRLLRELANGSPHIRNMTTVGVIVLDALKRTGVPLAPHRARQLAIGPDHIGKFRHPSLNPRRPSAIVIVRRDGQGEREFRTVTDALAFHASPWLP